MLLNSKKKSIHHFYVKTEIIYLTLLLELICFKTKLSDSVSAGKLSRQIAEISNKHSWDDQVITIKIEFPRLLGIKRVNPRIKGVI